MALPVAFMVRRVVVTVRVCVIGVMVVVVPAALPGTVLFSILRARMMHVRMVMPPVHNVHGADQIAALVQLFDLNMQRRSRRQRVGVDGFI